MHMLAITATTMPVEYAKTLILVIYPYYFVSHKTFEFEIHVN